MSIVRAFLVDLPAAEYDAEYWAGCVTKRRDASFTPEFSSLGSLGWGNLGFADFSAHLIFETSTTPAFPDIFRVARRDAETLPVEWTRPEIRWSSAPSWMNASTRSSGSKRDFLILGIEQIPPR